MKFKTWVAKASFPPGWSSFEISRASRSAHSTWYVVSIVPFCEHLSISYVVLRFLWDTYMLVALYGLRGKTFCLKVLLKVVQRFIRVVPKKLIIPCQIFQFTVWHVLSRKQSSIIAFVLQTDWSMLARWGKYGARYAIASNVEHVFFSKMTLSALLILQRISTAASIAFVPLWTPSRLPTFENNVCATASIHRK